MPAVVDLHSKVISPLQKIWIVHPGRNRSHVDVFREQQAVFLEFPGLHFTPATAGDDASIRQRIRYSRSIRTHRGLQKEDGSPILLRDFSGKVGNDVSIHLRTVKHLISRMEAGDLVVVPGRGAGGQVLFGEVAGSFFPEQTIRVPGLEFAETPVRKVDWLQERPKLDLPPQLVRFFEKPPAIAEVARDTNTDRFFDYAYDAYSTERLSWVSIKAPNYDGRDFLSVVAPAQLLALAVAMYRAVETHADLTGKSYEEIISTYYDSALLSDAQVKFASPGKYNIKDRDALLAQFINAFVALAIAGALVGCSDATVVNSESPNDALAPGIQSMINEAGRSAGGDVLSIAQEQGKTAKTQMNLSAPATVHK